MRTPALVVSTALALVQSVDAQTQPRTALQGRIQLTHPEIALHAAADEALRGRRYAEAAEMFRQALELDPENATLAYGLARCFPFNDATESALAWLERAIALGYRDTAMVQRDFGGRRFEGEPRFAALIASMGTGGQAAAPARDWFLAGSGGGASASASDGSFLARAYTSGGIDLFDTRPEANAAALRVGRGRAPAVALSFSPDASTLVSLHADGSLLFSSVASGESRAVNALSPGEGLRGAPWLFHTCGGTRVVAQLGDDLVFWDLDGQRVGRAQLERTGYSPPTVSAPAIGPRLAWAFGCSVLFLDACDGSPLAGTLEYEHRVTALAWSPAGDRLAVGTEQATLRFLRASDLSELWRGTVPDSMTGAGVDPFGSPIGVRPIVFSPSGRHVVACTVSGFHVGCFDAETGERLWRTQHLGGRMGASMPIAVSGTLVVGDAGVHAWELVSGDPSWEWRRGSDPARVLRNAGAYFLGLRKGAFHLLDPQTGAKVRELAPSEPRERWIEHPSGWCAGDPTGLDVDPRTFDPHRIRSARRGVRLLPVPKR